MAELAVGNDSHVCQCGKSKCEKNGCCNQNQKIVGCCNTGCKGDSKDGDPASCSHKNNCPVFLKFNNIKTLEVINE